MNFWIFQDKPNKRITIHRAECGTRNGRQAPLFPREDRGTDRIPTTMRRSAKRKRCLHVKALKFCHPQYSPRQWDGEGTEARNRLASRAERGGR
jgi:hypothetical protein